MPLRLPKLRSPSPAILALAGAWSVLVDLAVVALAVVVIVDAWAPPQDLSWKPLRLDQPIGLATRFKFAQAVRDPFLCRRVLREGGVTFRDTPARSAGVCGTANAGRLQVGATALSPAAPVMTCPLALGYAFWDRHVLQPAAHDLLGTAAVRVDHYGTYACRNIYGRKEGRPSEHAQANAIDVSAVRLADGRRLTVAGDFRRPDAAGRFLRRVRDGACPWFRAVLSPDYNAAHRDHLHLDFGRYRACR